MSLSLTLTPEPAELSLSWSLTPEREVVKTPTASYRTNFSKPAVVLAREDSPQLLTHQDWVVRMDVARQQRQREVKHEQCSAGTSGGLLEKIKSWASGAWQKAKSFSLGLEGALCQSQSHSLRCSQANDRFILQAGFIGEMCLHIEDPGC